MREKGFALLIVLWTMALLALLATRVAASGRMDAAIAANLRGGAEAEAAADAGVQNALYHLLIFGRGRWTPSGQHRLILPHAAVAIHIEPLAGRLNVNTASPALLAALLMEQGASPHQAAALAAAIVDWRMPGQRPSPGGARAPQYRAAGRAWGPPGAPFHSRGELADVLGMTSPLLARLWPHVTVWGDGDPDPALADRAVLAALHAVQGGSVPRAPTSDSRIVAITAQATVAGGGSASLRAVLEIAPTRRGKPWRMLAWGPPRNAP